MNLDIKIKSRRQLLTWVLLIASCMVLSGCVGKKEKIYRVGILSSFAPFAAIADGFKAKMTELGYAEGRNIVYDLQVKHVDPVGQQEVVKKFVKDKVDLIFTFPTEASIIAKAGTKGTNIPIVFAMAAIEGNNLVESVHHPGGNITGVRYTGPDNTLKRFEILCELVPDIKRLYTTYNKNYPANMASLKALRPVLKSLGIKFVEVPVSSLEEIEADLQARSASGNIGMDAILIMPDDLSQSSDGFALIAGFAAEHKVPIGGGASMTANQGAVFSYVADFFEVGGLAATLADKIFRGTPAGTIPVVTPGQILRLNYKVAKELGLKVSKGMMSRAREIIH